MEEFRGKEYRDLMVAEGMLDGGINLLDILRRQQRSASPSVYIRDNETPLFRGVYSGIGIQDGRERGSYLAVISIIQGQDA